MYVDDGEKFKVTDDWLKPSNAHRPLRGSWTGSTSFVELPDYIEEPLVRGEFLLWEFYDQLVVRFQQIVYNYVVLKMIIVWLMIPYQKTIIVLSMIP